MGFRVYVSPCLGESTDHRSLTIPLRPVLFTLSFALTLKRSSCFHFMQVSESAASALNVELALQSCQLWNAEKLVTSEDDGGDRDPGVRLDSLQSQGIMVGLRVTERLLYREPVFNGTPLEVARFVSINLWKAMFGKKVDSLKSIDKVFHIYDRHFRWLQGFPKLKGVEYVDSITSTLHTKSTDDGSAQASSQEFDGLPHKSILVYTVGIIRGAANTLSHGAPVSVVGRFSKDGETHFVLEFGRSG